MGNAKVTVWFALTAVSHIVPFSPFIPDGISTDKIGIPESLISFIASDMGGFTAPDIPVPKRASITRSPCNVVFICSTLLMIKFHKQEYPY